MPIPSGISPAPYVHEADERVGVLVLHGFTGSVSETRPLGEHLAARGWTVRCPLLPRHGTRVEDLTRGSYQEWLDEARRAHRLLDGRCEHVFVVGLSLGSLIALRLVEEDRRAQHAITKGVVALSPAVRVQSKLLPLAQVVRHVRDYDFGAPKDDSVDRTALERNWCYDKTPLWGAAEVWRLQRLVRRDLFLVEEPLLVVQARRDAVLDPRAGAELLGRVRSKDTQHMWLEHSGHNVLLDGERHALFERIAAWVDAHAH